MTHRFKLDVDVNAQPWTLLEHIPFREKLGLPVEPYRPGLTVHELRTPTLGPGTVEEPLLLDVAGSTPASLLMRSRGFTPDATTDLLVSPALDAVLSAGRLPAHGVIVCVAFVFPTGSFGVLPKNRKPKGPHPFRWLWWQDRFEGRLDPQKSRFRLRYPDGTTDYASYECLEDLAQVKHRAATTLSFDLSLDTVAWADPAIDALDVVPMGHDGVFLSDAMAERLRAAALPGIEIRPVAR